MSKVENKILREDHQFLTEALLHRANNDCEERLFFVKANGEYVGHHYSDVYAKAAAFAHHLIELGVEEGDKIALVIPTCVEFFYCFFGAQLAGAIPFSVYPPMQLGKIDEWQENLKTLLTTVDTRLILTNKVIKKLLVEPAKAANVSLGTHTVETFGIEKDENIDRVPNEIAFIQYSSGSTGFPKPIAISHKAALHNAAMIASQHLSVEKENIRMVSWLPLYHDMGLVGACFATLITHGSLHLIRPENFIGNPLLWLKTISKTKATVTVAPNFSYGLCVRRITDEQALELDLSSLVLAGCGAEMIQPQTVNEFLDKFSQSKFPAKAFTPCYGLAECTLMVTMSKVGEGVKFKNFDQDALYEKNVAKEVKQGMPVASLGVAAHGCELEIRNKNGVALSNGKVGDVFAKSPSLMSSFYGMPERTKETIQHGWLNTGDIGFLYQDHLYLLGRKKDTIIIRGKNIDPTFIERSLLKVDSLRAGSYTAFSSHLAKDKTSDTEGLVIVCETKKESLTSEEKEKVLKTIRRVVFSDHSLNVSEIVLLAPKSIPRTSSGKIKRNETKNLWFQKALISNKSSKILSMFKVGKALIKGNISEIHEKISRNGESTDKNAS